MQADSTGVADEEENAIVRFDLSETGLDELDDFEAAYSEVEMGITLGSAGLLMQDSARSTTLDPSLITAAGVGGERWNFYHSGDQKDDGTYFTNFLIPETTFFSPNFFDTEHIYLYVADRTKYETSDNFLTMYRCSIEHHTITQQGAPTNRISLRTYSDYERTERVDVERLNDLYFGVFRLPPYLHPIEDLREIASPDEKPFRFELDDHEAYGDLGVRRTSFNLTARDPLLCGYLSPFPQIDCKRPINSGAVTLPKRLGTFEIEYKTAAAEIATEQGTFDVNRLQGSKISLQAEYLSEPADEKEEHSLYCPQFIRQTILTPAPLQKYKFTLRNGPPSFIYIRHGGVEQFTFYYRDKACPVLEHCNQFDLFKMLQRCCHDLSTVTFKEWASGDRDYLIRAEELGFWGSTSEFMDRYVLEFEILAQNNISKVEIYYIYENFALEESHYKAKFTFV